MCLYKRCNSSWDSCRFEHRSSKTGLWEPWSEAVLQCNIGQWAIYFCSTCCRNTYIKNLAVHEIITVIHSLCRAREIVKLSPLPFRFPCSIPAAVRPRLRIWGRGGETSWMFSSSEVFSEDLSPLQAWAGSGTGTAGHHLLIQCARWCGLLSPQRTLKVLQFPSSASCYVFPLWFQNPGSASYYFAVLSISNSVPFIVGISNHNFFLYLFAHLGNHHSNWCMPGVCSKRTLSSQYLSLNSLQ